MIDFVNSQNDFHGHRQEEIYQTYDHILSYSEVSPMGLVQVSVRSIELTLCPGDLTIKHVCLGWYCYFFTCIVPVMSDVAEQDHQT